jgi:predicted component of type VI protein secretion system
MADGAPGFVEELEAELRAVVDRYKPRIREAYARAAPDPQALDGSLDAVVASVIASLEEAGYCFDTASVDNVLYHLGRTIKAEEGGWGVVYSR